MEFLTWRSIGEQEHGDLVFQCFHRGDVGPPMMDFCENLNSSQQLFVVATFCAHLFLLTSPLQFQPNFFVSDDSFHDHCHGLKVIKVENTQSDIFISEFFTYCVPW